MIYASLPYSMETLYGVFMALNVGVASLHAHDALYLLRRGPLVRPEQVIVRVPVPAPVAAPGPGPAPAEAFAPSAMPTALRALATATPDEQRVAAEELRQAALPGRAYAPFRFLRRHLRPVLFAGLAGELVTIVVLMAAGRPGPTAVLVSVMWMAPFLITAVVVDRAVRAHLR